MPGVLDKVPPLPCFNRETSGSRQLRPALNYLLHPCSRPEFPGYPFEQMTRSQIPVVISILVMSYSGLLTSRISSLSAFT